MRTGHWRSRETFENHYIHAFPIFIVYRQVTWCGREKRGRFFHTYGFQQDGITSVVKESGDSKFGIIKISVLKLILALLLEWEL